MVTLGAASVDTVVSRDPWEGKWLVLNPVQGSEGGDREVGAGWMLQVKGEARYVELQRQEQMLWVPVVLRRALSRHKLGEQDLGPVEHAT